MSSDTASHNLCDDTFGFATLTAELTLDEGCRAFPYTDSLGYLSIGRGRNLTGKGLSSDEVELLFANDVAECCRQMDTAIPWWRAQPAQKQRAMINLCFMGWHSFSTFHRFLAAMEAGNYALAGAELVDSRWWTQVGTRGPRVLARLLDPELSAGHD